MRNTKKLKIFYSLILVAFMYFSYASEAFAVTFSATGTNHTGTYQTYVVPSTGTYTIEAWGAEGGNYASSGFANGGKGAYIKGDFNLTAGQTLQILVGQKPADSSGASGGGGGSFVAQGATYASATLLLAAGGGGGRGSSVGGANLPDGNVSTTGSNGNYAGGAGPSGAADANNSGWGGPGAGFSGNGPTQANYGGTAYSFTNGGTGGAVYACAGFYGGFGGGGGGGCNGGGGGGGYGGGGAGGPGGGGSSYNGGTNQTNTAGLRTGNGQVIITPPVVTTPTITTPSETNVTHNSATLGGNITSQGGSAVSARGVCVHTSDTTPTIAEGATCVAHASGGTGVFTVNFTNLNPSTRYHYSAYATNGQGTAYTAPTTLEYIDTLTNLPSGATATDPDILNSYRVILKGTANPNGFTNTKGHFRVYTQAQLPANCNSDTGGTRFPYMIDGTQDVPIPANSAPTNYEFTIPLSGGIFLEPNTTYNYCGFVKNDNGTLGSSNIKSFITPDGPASPCDPPSSGNLTIPAGASCTFNGTFTGVDSGTGTTNTASLTIPSGSTVVLGGGQRLGRGSVVIQNGASITLAQGAGIVRGGVYVPDADGDSYLDSANLYVGSSPPAGYIRRNLISSVFNYAWKIASSGATFDCNSESQYAYRTVQNLVTDADQDGYKTAAAAGPQCVGASTTINGRVYYNGGGGAN